MNGVDVGLQGKIVEIVSASPDESRILQWLVLLGHGQVIEPPGNNKP